MASSRIQRWALTLGAYICYKAGKNLGNADALSRLPRPITTSYDKVPGDLVHLLNHMSSTTVNASSIKQWTNDDPTLAQVLKYVGSGWPRAKLSGDFLPYLSRKDELSILDSCVLWRACVIIHPQGRKKVLKELHDCHQGLGKMKAHNYIGWPRMDKEIEKFAAQTARNTDTHLPWHHYICGSGLLSHGVDCILITLDLSKATCT